ncbi:hypothetical protein TNCV_713171 [Trichonephila clavipes]|nr:hypothetical protein TNCV_713171 [Trichonephila clavipes]
MGLYKNCFKTLLCSPQASPSFRVICFSYISLNLLICIALFVLTNTVGFPTACLPYAASRKEENGVLGLPLAPRFAVDGGSESAPVNEMVGGTSLRFRRDT